MNVIFVAGTDTGVGKTTITNLLARQFSSKGYKVAVQKWVETGVTKSPAVFSFRLAASPHLAAAAEGRTISIKKIKDALKQAAQKHNIVIVEGTGGLLVPITTKKLFIDLVKELKLPVLLVAANRLGAINHTLLSIDALKARKIRVLGVVFNNLSKSENPLVLKDNPKIVKKFIGKTPIWINGYRKT